MEFQKLIEARRSVRKYSPEGKVSRDDILTIIKAAQEAPSWKNSQTGRYYCILSEDMVNRFREECLPEMNRTKSQNAALIVTTFVRDRAGFQKDGTPDNELGNGWGCYDLGLQNENFILKAEELGYATLVSWVSATPAVSAGLLDIPETEIVVAVIAIGKAGEEPARPKRKEIEEIHKILLIARQISAHAGMTAACRSYRSKNRMTSINGNHPVFFFGLLSDFPDPLYAFISLRPQHCLYFLPLPQGQGSLGYTFSSFR